MNNNKQEGDMDWSHFGMELKLGVAELLVHLEERRLERAAETAASVALSLTSLVSWIEDAKAKGLRREVLRK